ncbi:DUF5134 domain-containing protein [Streptomyces sp. NPDC005498]|uniref:DUF5134 domain-containing protein n=1 Tax=Streptomyces sp. NPDC005498 TaxID=3364717 RepID=UPI0036C892BB
MIAATGLRWILTLLFCVLAAYGLWRALAPAAAGHRWAARLTHGLHAVMAAAMAAMAWAWGMDLLVVPQVVFFSLAAAWFLIVAVAWPGGVDLGRALLGAVPHLVMTGAMPGDGRDESRVVTDLQVLAERLPLEVR